MASVYIAGAGGRVGRAVAAQAAAVGLEIAASPDGAAAWLIALPRTVVEGDLAHWTAARDVAVVDLSGAFKARGVGSYALLADDRCVWSGEPIGAGRLFANPGCIAGAVIAGLTQSGLRAHVAGGLHVTAVTAGSAAKAATRGTVRTGHLWWAHPHVAEIEQALGLACASFVPVVDYGLTTGIIATISGAAGSEALALPGDGGEAIDVAQVQGSAALRWHRRVYAHPTLGVTFTVVVAVDNLVFPAANAVAVAAEWLAARGRR